nr:hypothetical transcript [Hymenolepis microstoma]
MEHLAETWAKGCDGKTAADRNTYLTFKISKPHFANVLYRWYEEQANYIYPLNDCKYGKECDQYMNMIWAGLNSVSCAVVECSSSTPTFPKPVHVCACANYPPRRF